MIKQGIAIIVLLVLVLTSPSCRDEQSPIPLKFKGYGGNPVLVPGEPGSWDDLYVINAFEMKYQDTIYMFYSAYSKTGNRALGLATSVDGYNFTKFEGNPILQGDGNGYDAFGVAQADVIKEDSCWALYFNAREIAGFSSGPSFGRATANSLKGPWEKSEDPVMTTGKKGEWDSDFIYLGPVLRMEDGSYIMYYAGGEDIISQNDFFIGMATSNDGINWIKYNDPATTQHPFADSDPVLMTGKPGEWDGGSVLTGMVLQAPEGLEMYYAGGNSIITLGESKQNVSVGCAFSKDGIRWEKYRNNPIYAVREDPYASKLANTVIIQGPKFVFMDSLCLMYYDYGHNMHSAISVAASDINR